MLCWLRFPLRPTELPPETFGLKRDQRPSGATQRGRPAERTAMVLPCNDLRRHAHRQVDNGTNNRAAKTIRRIERESVLKNSSDIALSTRSPGRTPRARPALLAQRIQYEAGDDPDANVVGVSATHLFVAQRRLLRRSSSIGMIFLRRIVDRALLRPGKRAVGRTSQISERNLGIVDIKLPPSVRAILTVTTHRQH